MTKSNDIVILSTDHNDVLFDKAGLVAEYHTSTFREYLMLDGELRKYGFFHYRDGKDEGIKKTESNYVIKLSWNSDESTFKLRFEFLNGFPKFEKDSTARNFILNHPALRATGKNDIRNWDLKEFGEFDIDWKDFTPGFLLNLGKTLDLLYQNDRDYYKAVYIDNLYVKLYKKKGRKPRLEVVYKKGENPLPVITKITNEKVRLQEVEYRNELYFQNLQTTFEDSKRTTDETNENMKEMKEDQITILYQLDQLRYKEQKETEILSNQTEILLKLVETQDLLIKNIQMIQEQLAQNYETLFYQNRELMGKMEAISTRIETESRNTAILIRESGFGFKVKQFLKEVIKKIKSII